MNGKNAVKGAFLALCLIGMLVLPASASTTGTITTGKASAIDAGLKDDLWNSHVQHRLAIYDSNVQYAQNILSTLEKYGIDATPAQATLTTISGKRSDLETALQNRDQAALKTINADLLSLWKEFRTEVKDAIRSHYKGSSPATVPSTVAAGNAGPASV